MIFGRVAVVFIAGRKDSITVGKTVPRPSDRLKTERWAGQLREQLVGQLREYCCPPLFNRSDHPGRSDWRGGT